MTTASWDHSSNNNDNNTSPTRRAATINNMMEQLAVAEGMKPIAKPPKSCDSDISVTTKSIASSSALVGETIMESPSSGHSALYQNAKMRHLLEQQQQGPSKKEWVTNKVNAGLEWIQRKRQERQQAALEQQVEEQRRILYEAQHGPSLSTNTAFASVSQQKIPLCTAAQLSRSGSGMQVDVLNMTPQEQQQEDNEEEDDEDVLPQVRLVPEPPEAPPFMLSQTIMQLLVEQALPPSISYCRWRRLYCLARDGDDFGEFLRKCDKQTHTLLVVKTTRGHVFGGYVESPWVPHHEGFYGLGQACLFKVIDNNEEESIQVFKWTGVNRYIQVCDASSSMICFGGGGDSFGLCLEQDFSVGSTGACETFGNEPLCNQDNFEVLNVEVYGFLLGQF